MAAPGQRQQDGVQGQQAQPLAQPDLPAGDGFDGHHLHLAFLDVPGQGAAGEPEGGETEQRGHRAQGVCQ